MPFCKNCGAQIGDAQKFCEKCGAGVNATPVQNPAANAVYSERPAQADTGDASQSQKRSGIALFWLCFFFGGLGIHQFYARNTKRGLVYLLVSVLAGWLVIPAIVIGILSVIDLWKISHGTFKSGNGVQYVPAKLFFIWIIVAALGFVLCVVGTGIVVSKLLSPSDDSALSAEMTSVLPEGDSPVQTFVRLVGTADKEKLADIVSYPLSREFPIPAIKNKSEFVQRYKEIFDDSLAFVIVSSNLENDWSEIGWRGIMLNDGLVWLSAEGLLTAVNYHSAVENAGLQKLIEKDKARLYESLREYKKPVCVLETKKYLIRIDEMGENDYRYAAWNKGTQMSEKPNIIMRGTLDVEGSMGSESFVFNNGNYQYTYDRTGGTLSVYEGDNELSTMATTEVDLFPQMSEEWNKIVNESSSHSLLHKLRAIF
jgi:TM2 domain-containing membrane protein YozV